MFKEMFEHDVLIFEGIRNLIVIFKNFIKRKYTYY